MTQKENFDLCNKYPFLMPSGAWLGARPFDFSFTALDGMPSGWRKAFGEQMCAELRDALNEVGLLASYHVTLIKEKYGSLRWCDNLGTKKTEEILRKYERMSEETCVCCGKPATKITMGWICPYCDSCVPANEHSIPIEEYYIDD